MERVRWGRGGNERLDRSAHILYANKSRTLLHLIDYTASSSQTDCKSLWIVAFHNTEKSTIVPVKLLIKIRRHRFMPRPVFIWMHFLYFCNIKKDNYSSPNEIYRNFLHEMKAKANQEIYSEMIWHENNITLQWWYSFSSNQHNWVKITIISSTKFWKTNSLFYK